MDQEEYLKEIDKRLHRLFAASKEGYESSDTERHRLEGFIQGGVFLGLTSNAEVSRRMEAIHQSIFHKTIQERKTERPVMWSGDSIDYGQYDQPAFERKR